LQSAGGSDTEANGTGAGEVSVCGEIQFGSIVEQEDAVVSSYGVIGVFPMEMLDWKRVVKGSSLARETRRAVLD
jgi:hypothetical protein